MKTIEQLQSELRTFAADMNSELEQLKEQRADSTLTADFSKLSASASRYPIERHPLESQDEHTKKCYITLLLTVARFEPEMLSESLLFAHRVAFGMYYLAGGEDLKDEFLSSQTLTFEQLDEVTNLFRKSELRLMLIEECLLMAGAFDKGRKAAFEYIAQLAVMLNVDKEELTMLSNMAAVILTDDLSQYKCEIANQHDIFACYLNKFEPQFAKMRKMYIPTVTASELRKAAIAVSETIDCLSVKFEHNCVAFYLDKYKINERGERHKLFSRMAITKCENGRVYFYQKKNIGLDWYNEEVYNKIKEYSQDEAAIGCFELLFAISGKKKFLDGVIKGTLFDENDVPESILTDFLKSQKLGVLTHWLDNNKTAAYQYFIAHGGKPDENNGGH